MIAKELETGAENVSGIEILQETEIEEVKGTEKEKEIEIGIMGGTESGTNKGTSARENMTGDHSLHSPVI